MILLSIRRRFRRLAVTIPSFHARWMDLPELAAISANRALIAFLHKVCAEPKTALAQNALRDDRVLFLNANDVNTRKINKLSCAAFYRL